LYSKFIYDLITQSLVLYCIIGNYYCEYNQDNFNLRICMAFALILVWLGFISQLRGFKRIGFFIRIFLQVFGDIKYLTLIIVLFLV
jgi:hypothetical protein